MPLWLNASTRRLGSKNIRPQSLLGRLDLIRRAKAAMPMPTRRRQTPPSPSLRPSTQPWSLECEHKNQLQLRLCQSSQREAGTRLASKAAVQYKLAESSAILSPRFRIRTENRPASQGSPGDPRRPWCSLRRTPGSWSNPPYASQFATGVSSRDVAPVRPRKGVKTSGNRRCW